VAVPVPHQHPIFWACASPVWPWTHRISGTTTICSPSPRTCRLWWVV